MYAIRIDETKRLLWSEVPDPRPRPDEVLIDVRAAALNRADLLQREGNYPPPPGWPTWPGLEVAGLVRQAPAGSRWKAGDRVCALLGGGGYAQQVAVPVGMVLPIPGTAIRVTSRHSTTRSGLPASDLVPRPKNRLA